MSYVGQPSRLTLNICKSVCFTVVTKRIANPLSVEEAVEVIDTHRQYGIAYLDALIVAAAERASTEACPPVKFP